MMDTPGALLLRLQALAFVLLWAGFASAASPSNAPPTPVPSVSPPPVSMKAPRLEDFLKSVSREKYISAPREKTAARLIAFDSRISQGQRIKLIKDLADSIPQEPLLTLLSQIVDQTLTEQEIQHAIALNKAPLIKKWDQVDEDIFSKLNGLIRKAVVDNYLRATGFKFDSKAKSSPSWLTQTIWKYFPEASRQYLDLCPLPLEQNLVWVQTSTQALPPLPPEPIKPQLPAIPPALLVRLSPRRSVLLNEYVHLPKFDWRFSQHREVYARLAVLKDPRIPVEAKFRAVKELTLGASRESFDQAAQEIINGEYTEQELEYLVGLQKYSLIEKLNKVDSLFFEKVAPIAEELAKANYEKITRLNYGYLLAPGGLTQSIWKWFPQTLNPDQSFCP